MSGSSRATRLRVVVTAILAIGWAAALAIYLTAAPAEENPDISDMEHSKSYVRQLEVIGGKAAVVGNEITDWFDSLWQGQRLAYTVAALAVVVAGLYALWDRRPGPPAR